MTTPAQDTPSYAAAYAERFPDLDVLQLADPSTAFADLHDDPGAELVDAELGLTADDLTPTLLAAPSLVADAQLDHAADYVWCTWLADELRAVGLVVVEHPSWRTRGRPRSVGRFNPHGVLWHHDGSTIGPSPYVAKFLAETGRPAEGIPAPLSQLWVCEGCNGAHPMGTWHVLAAGRANHGGLGDGWGAIPKDSANATTIGVETDNTVNEATPPAMYQSLVVGTAAILRKLGATPSALLAGHKEYAPHRKTDPDDIVMSKGRADVALEMLRQAGHPGTPAKPTPPKPTPPAKPSKPAPRPAVQLVKFPGAATFQLGKKSRYTTMLGQWLIKAGYGKSGNRNGYQAGPTFTRFDQANVAAFQRSRPALRGDADGIPGPVTWELLQKAAAGK